MKTTFLICIIFFLSCESKINKAKGCQALIKEFNFPEDIEKLESYHYVCNPRIPVKLDQKCRMLFDDENYSLITYDYKTRVFIDKRKKINLIFKGGIPDSFYDAASKRGLVTRVYLVDSNFMPLFSVDPSGILIYKNDNKVKRSFATRVLLGDVWNLSEFETMTYHDLLSLLDSLLKRQFTTRGGPMETAFYDNPPVWTDL